MQAVVKFDTTALDCFQLGIPPCDGKMLSVLSYSVEKCKLLSFKRLNIFSGSTMRAYGVVTELK